MLICDQTLRAMPHIPLVLQGPFAQLPSTAVSEAVHRPVCVGRLQVAENRTIVLPVCGREGADGDHLIDHLNGSGRRAGGPGCTCRNTLVVRPANMQQPAARERLAADRAWPPLVPA